MGAMKYADQYLPKAIYDFLPTLYVLAGSLLAAYGPGSIGKPSAILLVVTGCAVFNMRLNNRS